MTTNQPTYRQRPLSRRSLLRRAGLAAGGLGALALAGCMGKSDKGDSSMGGPAGPSTKGEASPLPTWPGQVVPAREALGPAEGELVLLAGRSPNLRVFDAATGTLKRSADVPDLQAWSLNDSENYFDGRNLWAAAFSSSRPAREGNAEVILIDLDTLTVADRIAIGREAETASMGGVMTPMISIGHASPDGHVYVAKMMEGEVLAIDARTHAILNRRKLDEGPGSACDCDFGVAGDGAGRLYVATNDKGKVLLVNPRTLDTKQAYTAPAGVWPWMVTVAPGGEQVWVLNMFANTYRAELNSVTVLDARTMKVIKEMDSGRTPYYVGFASDGSFAYVTHSDWVHISIFDAGNLTETARYQIPTGVAARVAAVHPDGRSLLVPAGTANDSWLARLDLGTGTIATIPLTPPVPYSTMAATSGVFMRPLEASA